jgi:hypothetical protein
MILIEHRLAYLLPIICLFFCLFVAYYLPIYYHLHVLVPIY